MANSAMMTTGASALGSMIETWGSSQAAKTTIDANLSSTLSKINSSKEAVAKNLSINNDSYLVRMNASYEQEQVIENELGTALSRRGIDAMKAHSRLIAAGASTGFSGASISEISNQAGYDQMLDSQIILSRARQSKADLARQKVTDWMNFKTQGSNLQNGLVGEITGGTSSGNSQALTSGLGTLLSGVTTYMSSGGTFDFGNNSGNGYGEVGTYTTSTGEFVGL